MRLTSVVVNGSTVFDAPQLFNVYRAQLGQPIARDSVREIVAALGSLYEARGYARPQVSVDDALLAAGVLRVEIREPKLGDVSINGDPGPHRERLESLGADLQALQPVRPATLQTALLEMRDLPGLTVAASTARDADEPHVYKLTLDADFDRIAGNVRFSNRGTNEVGPHFMVGQVIANGLLDGGTNLGLMFGTAAGDLDEYRALGLISSTALGDGGARLSTSAFRSRSAPNEIPVDRDDDYLRDRITLRATVPTDSRRFVPFGGLRLDDLEILRDGQRLRDERLRLLEGGMSWSMRTHERLSTGGSLEVVVGLDSAGAGLTAVGVTEDPRRSDFSLARMSLARINRLGDADLWTLRLDAFAQHSTYVLPYTERFKIGGDRLGRAFEVAEIAGDQGIGAKVEGRRRLPAAPSALGSVAVYGFYDVGAAFKNDLPGRESAATSGIGFSTQAEHTRAVLEIAKPLTRSDVEGNKDAALFVELILAF